MKGARWIAGPLLACLLALSGVFAGSAEANGGARATTPPAPAKTDVCTEALGHSDVAPPTDTTSWRAEIMVATPAFRYVPKLAASKPTRLLGPRNAPWVLVVRGPQQSDGRCWIKVRLPWRPNNAAGWINVKDVRLQQVHWRIVVSLAKRDLTLFDSGKQVRTLSAVIGKPSTPTPTGLFAIVWAIRWHPNDFLGSWVLELSGHSDVLQKFDGGDGTVGIHGRGGASLLDPLGSAASHGCVRLANDEIDWLVKTVGTGELPGTPVYIS